MGNWGSASVHAFMMANPTMSESINSPNLWPYFGMRITFENYTMTKGACSINQFISTECVRLMNQASALRCEFVRKSVCSSSNPQSCVRLHETA